MTPSKKRRGPPPRPQRILDILLAPGVIRVFLLGATAVVACVYALIRAYTHPKVPMVVPIASASASAPTELPAPELVPVHERNER